MGPNHHGVVAGAYSYQRGRDLIDDLPGDAWTVIPLEGVADGDVARADHSTSTSMKVGSNTRTPVPDQCPYSVTSSAFGTVVFAQFQKSVMAGL